MLSNADIRLILEEDIPSLEYTKSDWDVEIKGVPYQVIRVPGFAHCTGGHLDYGEGNIFWAYPLNEVLSIHNLREYNGPPGGVRWGLEFSPTMYLQYKWEEPSIESGRKLIITRNDKPFYDGFMSFHQAIAYVKDGILAEHPLDLNVRDFDKKCIGRKIWWRSEPAVITDYVQGQACVMIVPDGIDQFTVPAEYAGDPLFDDYEMTHEIKVEIFDKHVNWFRD